MKFEGDLTSIMVTRDFFGTATTTRFALTRQGNGCGVDMAIMMWMTEAEGWCWWDLWTPWPPSPGNFQEAKAYLHVLGQQRSLSTMSALCHTSSSTVSFGVTVWSWYSGMPAALLYCNSIIIACAKAIQDVQLEEMGSSVGEYNINALEQEDKMCVRKSGKRIETLHENKESRRGRSEKEEGKAGKNKLWMRKVQPTKLGPSQQLLVNILLGKWLEMCSFWTKFTSKSCPNLTHRLTLLHDFSVVVGQTPTEVYIFGSCD